MIAYYLDDNHNEHDVKRDGADAVSVGRVNHIAQVQIPVGVDVRLGSDYALD